MSSFPNTKEKNDTNDIEGPKKKRRKHTRVARACDNCRKQKTRCLRSGSQLKCLRCLAMNLNCSLEQEDLGSSPELKGPSPSTMNSDVLSQLSTISDDVKTILDVLSSNRPDGIGTGSFKYEDFNQKRFASQTSINMTSQPTNSTQNSSMSLMLQISRHLSTGNSLPETIGHMMGSNARTPALYKMTNIVTAGLITSGEVIKLLGIFRDRYGRWLSLPDTLSTDSIYARLITVCPLLLTIACTLSLKYSDPLLKDKCYIQLLRIIKSDLSACILDPPQCVEYVQCLVILSIYATNLSEQPAAGLCLDSWELSSMGISVFLKIDRLGLLNNGYNMREVDPDFNLLLICRLWNNLVLVHLVYSILSGHRSDFPAEILCSHDVSNFSMSTKFDYRIISECSIYHTLYRFTVLDCDSGLALKGIQNWKTQWDSMFGKPLNQFVEIDYHWANVLWMLKTYDIHIDKPDLNLKRGDSDAAGVLPRIIKHTSQVFKLMLTVKDNSYFAFLSDQIHMIVFLCCIVLIGCLAYDNDENTNDNDEDSEHNNTSGEVVHIDKEKDADLSILVSYVYRLRKVSTSRNDTFFKYSLYLDQYLRSKFGERDLQLAGLSDGPALIDPPYSFQDQGDEEEEAQELALNYT